MQQHQEFDKSLICPPPRLSISEWAEEHAWIPPEGNAEPGKFRLSRMPHEEEMLNDPMDPSVRETFWMLASQAGGKTLCLNLICEYVICQLRKSIIMVRATKETATEWMRDKFMPTVNATPCLAGLLIDPRKHGSNSTSLNRKYPGGSIKVIGAKSPAAFRGSSASDIYCDEIDSYVPGKEGDPIALADRAAITFADARKIKASTPTLDGTSRIGQGYDRGDQRKYFLPCPCCGHFQFLKTEQLKFSFSPQESARFEAPDYHPNNWTWEINLGFEIRDTRRAIYVCETCQRGWTDVQRIASYRSGHKDNPAIIANGQELRAHWKATAPFNGIRSRWMSGMYLTIGLEKGYDNYLQQFAENFLKAKRAGRDSLMVWTNTFCALPYADPAEKTDWKTIAARAEDYTGVPIQVMWIACGVDVHPDRVEIFSGGFGEGQEFWALDHQILWGDMDNPAMQDRVKDALIGRRFTHPVLGQMSYAVGAIDSGHQTKVKAVYQFCAKYKWNNFWSVKGFDNALGVVYERKTERVYGGLRFNLNTDYLKTLIFDRLKNSDPGPRYIHFPKSLPAKFYMQLCSESRVPIRDKKGFVKYQWQKHTSTTRNEALDCMVYLFGAHEIARCDDDVARKWADVKKKLTPPADARAPGELLTKESEKLPELRKELPPSKPLPRRRVMMVASPFRRRF